MVAQRCVHCQTLTRTLKAIQKDYAPRNVQVVECAFEEGVNLNYPMFLKTLEPNFATGYTTAVAVEKYLDWQDKRDGMLRDPVPDLHRRTGAPSGGLQRSKDGFFSDADKRIRAELDKMDEDRGEAPPPKKSEAPGR